MISAGGVIENGEPRQDVTFCWLGGRLLPVVSAIDAATPSATVDGKLNELSERAGLRTPWVQYLRDDHKLDAQSYDVFLSRSGRAERRREITIVAAYVFLTALGWVFWIRAFQRRRRAVTVGSGR